MDVAGAFVSFTEVTPDGHDAYNRWHLFDHLPEQYRLPGIAWGRRWAVRSFVSAATPPLERVDYVTLYLLTEPFTETIDAFQALGRELWAAGRFDDHRTSHLNGPLRIRSQHTVASNPLDPRSIPFAPHRTVRIVLDGSEGDGSAGADLDGAVGTWVLDGVDELAGRTLSVTWFETLHPAVPEPDRPAAFDAVLDVIDPFATLPPRTPPPGYATVTPRLIVADPDAQAAFLRDVFGATGDVAADRPAEIRIGDSLVLVSSGGDVRGAMPAFLYVYVDDVEATFERALAAGADTIEPPIDTPYGDRRAMVRDPFGNVFQIAHRRRRSF